MEAPNGFFGEIVGDARLSSPALIRKPKSEQRGLAMERRCLELRRSAGKKVLEQWAVVRRAGEARRREQRRSLCGAVGRRSGATGDGGAVRRKGQATGNGRFTQWRRRRAASEVRR
ncbi:hypothetical protein U1Q18_001528 [Sarracenia purpurea var. burkii]